MSNERLTKAIKVFIGVGVLGLLFGGGIAYLIHARSFIGDYDHYARMGRGVVQGFNPYDVDDVRYRWPPSMPVIFAPLAFFDGINDAATRVGYLFLTYLAFFDALRILIRRIYGKPLSLWPMAGRVSITMPSIALAIIVLSRFITETAKIMQVTFILLWLAVRATDYLERRKEARAAFFIGLSAAIKLTPAIWIGYAAFRGRWKAAVLSLLVIAFFFVLPFAVVGPERTHEYYDSWLAPGKLLSPIPTRAHNVSAFAMFDRWIGHGLWPWADVQIDGPLFASGKPAVMVVTAGFLLILGCAWIYYAGNPFQDDGRGTSIADRASRIVEEGLVMNLSLYASPLTWKHYYASQIYLLTGLFALWAASAPGRKRNIVTGLIVAGALLQSGLLPGLLEETLERQSIITLGSLCYFVAGLIFLKRKRVDAPASAAQPVLE